MSPWTSSIFLPNPTKLCTGPVKLAARLWNATNMPIDKCPSITRSPPTPRISRLFNTVKSAGTDPMTNPTRAIACSELTYLAW